MYGIKIPSFVSVALKFVKEEKKEKRLGLGSNHYMYRDLGVRKKEAEMGLEHVHLALIRTGTLVLLPT